MDPTEQQVTQELVAQWLQTPVIVPSEPAPQAKEMLHEASVLLENTAAQVEQLCKWAGYPMKGLPQWDAYETAWSMLQTVLDFWKSDE